MSRRVNQITIEGKQIRQAVNVGPRGPQGLPGAGARIEGVVNTVGDLPVAADPGSIWIVRPDMMHVWDEVDGWQAVGPVGVVTGPKINDLTTRPGGPQPTDEIWLASAGGAADFKSTINALAGAVFGNISGSQLNTLLRLQFACRCNASGTAISNISGRVPLSVTRTSTGVYQFTNAENRVFNTVVAANRENLPGRTYQVAGLNSTTLTVRWFNSEGNQANTEFAVMGQLD